MKTAQFRLNSGAMIALAISAAFPVVAQAAAGRVEFAIGGVNAITADGQSRPLSKGAEINSGDTIKTTDGRVQIRFTDGGYMSLQPNTEFIVENYNYEGKQDGSERGFFRLVEGGLRAITGIVGRNNRPAYRVATPVATIGIRGSEYLAEYYGKLKVRVIGGSIYIENEHGDLILFKGQSAEVEEDGKPQYSEEQSGVQAKGPEGGNPEQGEEESQQERENTSLFAVNDIRDEEGVSCALSGSCDQILSGGSELSNVLANYADQNAVGYYSGSSTTVLGNGAQIYASGSLTAYFGNYSVNNQLYLSAEVPDGSGSYFPAGNAYFYGNGSIAGNGTISLPNLTQEDNNSFCSSTCSVSGTGAFSGAAAESASINYSITGIMTNITSTGSANVNVPYNADYIAADGGEGAVLYPYPGPPSVSPNP